MKITKFNQSCLLVETNNKKILIDPGNIGYEVSLLNEWKDIDYILITHRHGDHCNVDAINTIVKRDNAKIYTTKEVADNTSLINPIIVKQGIFFKLISKLREENKDIKIVSCATGEGNERMQKILKYYGGVEMKNLKFYYKKI